MLIPSCIYQLNDIVISQI